MKITICVDRLTGGGAQRVASLWIQGFVNEGHDVSVVLSNVRQTVTYHIPEKVPIFNVDFNIRNGLVRHLCKVFFQTFKLKKIFKTIQPDLVIAVGIKWGPLIYRAKGDMCFKVIGTDHGSYERPPIAPMPPKVKQLKFEFNKKFDAVTVLTQADKDYIGDRLKNVYVLPNPLAFEPVSESRFTREKTILAVGRLNAPIYKGFDILIEAFGRIAKEFPEWKVLIMGEGTNSEREHLNTLAKNNGIEKSFEILPFQADPLPVFQKCGIFCLSSRYEGFGMVLIEAMSQGCACVACDYKGRQREIIPNDDFGLVCPAEDVDALASSLKKMMVDDDYRHHVEAKSPGRSKYYLLENIMQRWNKILKSAQIITK
jgi:glycosyltransferase involved in cell wall biosynthesis